MNTTSSDNWYEANQHYLSAVLATVRHTLQEYATTVGVQFTAPSSPLPDVPDTETMSAPPALETLCVAFGLSHFERNILLLCAGVELDASFARLCAAVQDDITRTYPTFSLALAAFAEPHWSALTPDAPLRRWRLIEVGTGNTLTASPLRIDERVLHYLVGIQHLDERLVGMIEPIRVTGYLTPSHHTLAEQITAAWIRAAGLPNMPIVQLCGDESLGKHTIAVAVCDTLGLNLRSLSAHIIPTTTSELEALSRLWAREAVLSSCALLLDCEDMDTTDMAQERAIARFIERINSPLFITSRERQRPLQRQIVTFDVQKPTTSEQRSAWQNALGAVAHSLNGKVDVLVSQFSLSTATIQSASAEILSQLAASEDADLENVLWDTCRVQARTRLDQLARRIEATATWDDLILPELQRQVLHSVSAHVRQRATVYEQWGFAAKGTRGLGISALFAGTSGTGKTMAAEVLANELRLDLYRIDLSQVVSKYIGETEKNLRRVFDAAEENGAILLFDEADALFGKRSEIKDSHDRYANIEVSYLLQRMEAYRGLAILTTNMKNALDTAFLRRIRFIVQFPFPDAAQRVDIWRRIFPANTPTEGLDATRLAHLNVTGGNIRNIALNAAFLAADAGEPVRMSHLLRAARGEYAKLEKSLTDAEIGGWV
ncbi:MAG: ATP-binding protein [Ktedonobacteraceae bacterium]